MKKAWSWHDGVLPRHWVNHRKAGNLSLHRAHYDVIVKFGINYDTFFESHFSGTHFDNPGDFAMAMGTEAHPVPSGVDLTKAPFKQCGAMDTRRYGANPRRYFVMRCFIQALMVASCISTTKGKDQQDLTSVMSSLLQKVGTTPLQWRHNDHDSVSNYQPHGCLLNCLFRRKSEKTSKLRVTGLCVGNSPGPVNSPHKGPVTWKMFPFDDFILRWNIVVRWFPFNQLFNGNSEWLYWICQRGLFSL